MFRKSRTSAACGSLYLGNAEKFRIIVKAPTGITCRRFLYSSPRIIYPGLFAATIQNSDFGQSDPVELVIAAGGGGGSGGGGAADPSDFFSITFYDWDGKTLLGSKVVPKSDNDAEQKSLVTEAMKKMQFEKSATEEQLNGDLWYDDASLPLTNKKGYTFGKWIDYDAQDENGNIVYTSYGHAVKVQDATQTEQIAEPIEHTFSAADRSGFSVKAAYCTNADMEPLNNLPASEIPKRNYTVSATDYLQFGGTTNYSIGIRVQRQQGDLGVHRVRELGLKVELKIKGASGSVFMLQKLDNQDDISTTIAVNAAVTSASVSVVDICDVLTYGGTSNWANGAVLRSNSLILEPGTGLNNPGFIQRAAVGYINDQCVLATAMGDTPADVENQSTVSGAVLETQNYTDAYLNITTVAGTSGGAVIKRRKAFANILEMYQSLPSYRSLSWDEIQEAITNGTVWNNETGGWTNGFTGKYDS